jgi:hypothetical protein
MGRKKEYTPPSVEDLLSELSAWGLTFHRWRGAGLARSMREAGSRMTYLVNELGRVLDSADQTFEALSKVLDLVADDDGQIEGEPVAAKDFERERHFPRDPIRGDIAQTSHLRCLMSLKAAIQYGRLPGLLF